MCKIVINNFILLKFYFLKAKSLSVLEKIYLSLYSEKKSKQR